MISLESRQDRRNIIASAARATNITLTLLNGITDAEVPSEKVPTVSRCVDTMQTTLTREGLGFGGTSLGSIRRLLFSHEGSGPVKTIATWTGHGNFANSVAGRMISENIATAVIMESDSDWDLRIRDILSSVAKGVKRVMDYPFSEDDDAAPSSQRGPYGDHWDVIWLGHCGAMGPYEGRVYPFNDPTSPPRRSDFSIVDADPPDPFERPDHVRMVFELRYNICTHAYAVSLEGARKLRKAGEESSIPWDLRLNNICRDNPTVRCATVWPQIISAAYSKPTIDYDNDGSNVLPLPADLSDKGAPGPAIQVSARRNSHLAGPELSPAHWLKEW